MSAELTIVTVFGVTDKEDNNELPNATIRRLIRFEGIAVIILQLYWPAGVLDRKDSHIYLVIRFTLSSSVNLYCDSHVRNYEAKVK